jgi:hypothetical protein
MSFDDERVRFYLRHREKIEEWAALRSESAVAVDEWLLGLRPDVERLARDLDRNVTLHVLDRTDEALPGYRLVRTFWPESGNPDPPASVGLEWIRGRTTLRASTSPYVGLRAPKERPLGALIRQTDSFRKARVHRKDTAGPWWVGYGYVSPSPAFPEDAEEYRAALIDALRRAWADYAPLVDAVVASP